MTNFYSATGLSPVADHATLTEIRSVNDISNAAIKMNQENSALQAEVAALKSIISPTK